MPPNHICFDDLPGRTPIHIAAEAGNIGVIQLLLENEADILATDKVGDGFGLKCSLRLLKGLEGFRYAFSH